MNTLEPTSTKAGHHASSSTTVAENDQSSAAFDFHGYLDDDFFIEHPDLRIVSIGTVEAILNGNNDTITEQGVDDTITEQGINDTITEQGVDGGQSSKGIMKAITMASSNGDVDQVESSPGEETEERNSSQDSDPPSLTLIDDHESVTGEGDDDEDMTQDSGYTVTFESSDQMGSSHQKSPGDVNRTSVNEGNRSFGSSFGTSFGTSSQQQQSSTVSGDEGHSEATLTEATTSQPDKNAQTGQRMTSAGKVWPQEGQYSCYGQQKSSTNYQSCGQVSTNRHSVKPNESCNQGNSGQDTMRSNMSRTLQFKPVSDQKWTTSGQNSGQNSIVTHYAAPHVVGSSIGGQRPVAHSGDLWTSNSNQWTSNNNQWTSSSSNQWTPGVAPSRSNVYNYYQNHEQFIPASNRYPRYNQVTGSFGPPSGINYNWSPVINNGTTRSMSSSYSMAMKNQPPMGSPSMTSSSMASSSVTGMNNNPVMAPHPSRAQFHPLPPKNSHKCHCIECGSITEVLDHHTAIVVRSPYYSNPAHVTSTIGRSLVPPSNRILGTLSPGQTMVGGQQSFGGQSQQSCASSGAQSMPTGQCQPASVGQEGINASKKDGIEPEVSTDEQQPPTPLNQHYLEESRANVEEWLEGVEAGRVPTPVTNDSNPCCANLGFDTSTPKRRKLKERYCPYGRSGTMAHGSVVNGQSEYRQSTYTLLECGPTGNGLSTSGHHSVTGQSVLGHSVTPQSMCPRSAHSHSLSGHESSTHAHSMIGVGTGTKRDNNFKQFEMELFEVGNFQLTNIGSDVEKKKYAMKAKLVFLCRRILFEFPTTFDEDRKINPCFALMLPLDSITGLKWNDQTPAHVWITVSHAPLVFASTNRATDAEISFDCTSIVDPTRGQIYHNKLYHFTLKGVQSERFVGKLTDFDARIKQLLIDNTIDTIDPSKYYTQTRLNQSETA